MEPIVIRIDGSCGPRNPGGKMGWGFVAERAGRVVYRGSGRKDAHPRNSNNVAEYLALLAALDWMKKEGLQSAVILSDSQLLVHQMNGSWGIGQGMYRDSALSARSRKAEFSGLSFRWVPREKNEAADALSRDGASRKRARGPKKMRPPAGPPGKESRLRELERENADLRRRVEALEERLADPLTEEFRAIVRA